MPATVLNAAREKLDQRQLSLGVGVRMTRSVEIAKAMAVAGFDWLFLDMEHGAYAATKALEIEAIALLGPGVRIRLPPPASLQTPGPTLETTATMLPLLNCGTSSRSAGRTD